MVIRITDDLALVAGGSLLRLQRDLHLSQAQMRGCGRIASLKFGVVDTAPPCHGWRVWIWGRRSVLTADLYVDRRK